jgi:glyoxylate/hydroxypyruvate reductase A
MGDFDSPLFDPYCSAMAVLIDIPERPELWVPGLREHLPGFEVLIAADAVAPVAIRGAIEYVVTWEMNTERLRSFPNLKGLLLAMAGYDHVDARALGPVPVVRLVDPGMADDIAQYVLSWVIHFSRGFDVFARAQRERTWISEPLIRFPGDVTVGVLGAGAIGQVVLATCASHGFNTIGWSRSNNDRSTQSFFEESDFVVNLVPLSPASEGLVGADELRQMGNGILINVGRGRTIDQAALIQALKADLRWAVLDVFDVEPLPTDSELWDLPNVTITPHEAGRTNPVTAAPIVAASILEIESGRRPTNIIEI